MGRLAEAQRRLLEQMMGPEAMGIVPVNMNWWDDKVCKNYICGTCPHTVFTNTKMDLGPCTRSHNEKLQTEFQAHKAEKPSDPQVIRIENEFERNIFLFVDDCDRRIRSAQKRLEKTPEENAKTTALMREIGEIEMAIQDGTTEIEQLGEAGKVDESMQKLAAVEALKAEKNDKEKELQHLAETAGASGHQKLRMHLGYAELRNLHKRLIEEQRARAHAPPSSLSGGRGPSAPSGAPSGPSGGVDRGYDDRRGGRYESSSSSRRYDDSARDRSRSPKRR